MNQENQQREPMRAQKRYQMLPSIGQRVDSGARVGESVVFEWNEFHTAFFMDHLALSCLSLVACSHLLSMLLLSFRMIFRCDAMR